jgi:hypothetical protein
MYIYICIYIYAQTHTHSAFSGSPEERAPEEVVFARPKRVDDVTELSADQGGVQQIIHIQVH